MHRLELFFCFGVVLRMAEGFAGLGSQFNNCGDDFSDGTFGGYCNSDAQQEADLQNCTVLDLGYIQIQYIKHTCTSTSVCFGGCGSTNCIEYGDASFFFSMVGMALGKDVANAIDSCVERPDSTEENTLYWKYYCDDDGETLHYESFRDADCTDTGLLSRECELSMIVNGTCTSYDCASPLTEPVDCGYAASCFCAAKEL